LPPPPPPLRRNQSTARHVLEPDAATRAFQAETQSAALHADAHHELDGFVHSGAHHPFALPDDDHHEAEDVLVYGSPRAPGPAAPHHLHDVELAPDGGTLLALGPRAPVAAAARGAGGVRRPRAAEVERLPHARVISRRSSVLCHSLMNSVSIPYPAR